MFADNAHKCPFAAFSLFGYIIYRIWNKNAKFASFEENNYICGQIRQRESRGSQFYKLFNVKEL
nr:MAG TPA: hypothetical protein [Caudoviricetes sp.]